MIQISDANKQVENPCKPITHLSHSQVNTYVTCSLNWWFSRRYSPTFVSSALPFGSGFHSACEAFYKARLEGRELTGDEMFDAFRKRWAKEDKPIKYGRKESEDGLHELAKKMISRFLESVRPGRVVAIEEKVECHLADGLPPLLGFVDLVEIIEEENGSQSLALIDFKTAARKPTTMNPDQLGLYQMALTKSGLIGSLKLPVVLEYVAVTKTKNPEVVRLPVKSNEESMNRLIAKFEVVYRGMQAGVCYPNPCWCCSFCGYQDRCRRWPND